jgi:hypothetical protein
MGKAEGQQFRDTLPLWYLFPTIGQLRLAYQRLFQKNLQVPAIMHSPTFSQNLDDNEIKTRKKIENPASKDGSDSRNYIK